MIWVNLANLALVRGQARSHDIAIPAALDASRVRLVRQFLTEHLLVTVAGGLLGALVGQDVLRSLKAVIPATGVRAAVLSDTVIAMDAPVWLFALLLSAVSGFTFGLAPAVGATRVGLTEAITASRSSN
jgi:ABC-type antimicrobial peptide transport system permease subunit